MTTQQRTAPSAAVLQSWQRNDRAEIAGLLEMLKMHEQVIALAAADRELARAQIQPALLAELRKQPDDEASRWPLDMYESAHAPIAAGDPLLTRQATDAYAEVLCFMIGQVLANDIQPDAQRRDRVCRVAGQ